MSVFCVLQRVCVCEWIFAPSLQNEAKTRKFPPNFPSALRRRRVLCFPGLRAPACARVRPRAPACVAEVGGGQADLLYGGHGATSRTCKRVSARARKTHHALTCAIARVR